MNIDFRFILERTVSLILAGIVISIVIVAVLFVVANDSSKRQQEALDRQTATQTAIGCELGVPAIDGVRDPALLRNCWTDVGLDPPAYFDET